MTKKRLRLSQLQAIDRASFEDEFTANCVRKLEMLVDNAHPRGYGPHCVQFWADVRLYGVREAVMYLEKVPGVKPEAVAQIKDYVDPILAHQECELCAR